MFRPPGTTTNPLPNNAPVIPPVILICVALSIAALLFQLLRRKIGAASRTGMRRLLMPLVFLVIGLLLPPPLLLLDQHRAAQERETLRLLEHVRVEFAVDIRNQTESLNIAIKTLLTHRDLPALLRSADTAAIAAQWSAFFQTLNEHHGITQFNIIDPERIILLRLHDPQHSGDRNIRRSAIEAERTGRTATSLEFSPFGELVIRVVVPVYDAKGLAGYIELGKNMNDIIAELGQRVGVDVTITMKKAIIERAIWESGMRAQKRVSDWNRPAGSVIVYSSWAAWPETFQAWLEQPVTPDGYVLEFVVNDRRWRVRALPWADTSDQTIGTIAIMHDITHAHALFRNTMALGGALIAIIFVLLTAVIRATLHRTDADIRRQHKELTESKAFLKQTLNSIPIPVFVKTRDGIYQLVNQAFERLFGIGQGHAIGKSLCQFYPHEEAAVHDAREQRLLREQALEVYECPLTDAEGRHHDAIFHRASMTGPDGQITGIVGAILDITDRKRSEAERINIQSRLLQVGKLEAAGQLAAGVAHEINTPIQFVGDNLVFLRDSFVSLLRLNELSDQLLASGTTVDGAAESWQALAREVDVAFLATEIPRALEESFVGIRRVGQIIAAMREFSHPDPETKTMVDVAACIQLALTMCRNEWKHVASVDVSIEPELPLIPCHAGAISQVLINLVINAAQAIAEDRVHHPDRPGLIRVSAAVAGPFVEIRVQDNGPGIPEAIRNNMFQPFFTTKEIGKGTGQGLYLARNIILKDHQGSIRFETEAGHGTVFIITLPLKIPGEKELLCK